MPRTKLASGDDRDVEAPLVQTMEGTWRQHVGRYDGGDPELGEPPSYSMFPFEPFGLCCSSHDLCCIPSQWLKIHNVPHLAVLLGAITSTVLLIYNITQMQKVGCVTRFCQVRVLTCLFVGCCLVYFFKTIQMYDNRLDEKLKAVKKSQEKHEEACQTAVTEMDGMLVRSMETSAGLAERSFESKRRDFQRFLARMGPRLDSIASKSRNEVLLSHFLGFVQRWLAIFSEASVDPSWKPRLLTSTAELKGCTTAREVATLVENRCRESTEVKLVSGQRDDDQNELSKLQKSLPRFRRIHKGIAAAVAGVASRRDAEREKGGDADLERGSRTFGKSNSSRGEHLTVGKHVNDFESVRQRRHGPWLKGHCWAGCGATSLCDDLEDNFPVELQCGCFTMRLLSDEHVRLLVALTVGCYLMGLQAFLHTQDRLSFSWFTSMNVFVCLVCISVILYEFRDIDKVQRLEKSIEELEYHHHLLKKKCDDMTRFYASVQTLADLWLYRTIPRLDVLNNFHGELEDADDSEFVSLLTTMIEVIDIVEAAVPPMKAWMGDSKSDSDWKQTCGNIVMRLHGVAGARSARMMAPSVSRALASVEEHVSIGASH